MHRFFVPRDWLSTERVHLAGPVAHQISRVLRLSVGDRVVLLDGSGKEFMVRLHSFSRDSIEGEVESVGEGRVEPRVHITLYQGLLKGEKLEWVLQKGTEMGVSVFVPLVCRRAVPERRGQELRMERWRRIMAEAAEQCGRSRLPELRSPAEFHTACDEAAASGALALIAWEQEEATGLSQALGLIAKSSPSSEVGRVVTPSGPRPTSVTDTRRAQGTEVPCPGLGGVPQVRPSPSPAGEGGWGDEVSCQGLDMAPGQRPSGSGHHARVALFIGPEGGFEEDEVAYARSHGITPVGLGRRILRAETAGLAAVAAIQFQAGELG